MWPRAKSLFIISIMYTNPYTSACGSFMKTRFSVSDVARERVFFSFFPPVECFFLNVFIYFKFYINTFILVTKVAFQIEFNCVT